MKLADLVCLHACIHPAALRSHHILVTAGTPFFTPCHHRRCLHWRVEGIPHEYTVGGMVDGKDVFVGGAICRMRMRRIRSLAEAVDEQVAVEEGG